MFVPVVRRRVTVTSRGVVDFPFHCHACGLATIAHVSAEGKGSASALYVKANADAAGQNAQITLRNNARNLFDCCPCPQCGAAPASVRDALARWESSREAKQKRRKLLGIIGIGAAVLTSSACSGIVVATDDGKQGTSGAVGGALIIGFMWFMMCAVVTGIVYALSGPGKKPTVFAARPQNVWFDPPQQAGVTRAQ
ncbi:MAG TPA: hypothetical protein VGI10_17855 [Polyangiaceae bacterium]|jgi:hypothetical protein